MFSSPEAPPAPLLSRVGLLLLIMLLGAYPPLTTDIYLPALPTITSQFQVKPSLTNLTLGLFFICFSFGMLLWGPFSDRWGRKRILYFATSIYIVASVLCAAAWNIHVLIAFRILQALGAAGSVTIALAMIKDVYPSEKREKVFAIVGTIMGIAPIVAPVFGAFLLEFTSWRGIFLALAGLGAVSLFGAICIQETCHERTGGNFLATLKRLWVVLKNPSFTIMVSLFSTMMIPILSFVGAASYIYTEQFGLSEREFSFFFAGNATLIVFGPILFIVLSKFFYRRAIITWCFVTVAVGGVLVLWFGSNGPWFFAVAVLPAGMAVSISRPPRMNLCLEQQVGDTGSASSLINCAFALAGSLGIMIVSFEWVNRIVVLGIVYLCVGVVGLLVWPIALRYRRRES